MPQFEHKNEKLKQINGRLQAEAFRITEELDYKPLVQIIVADFDEDGMVDISAGGYSGDGLPPLDAVLFMYLMNLRSIQASGRSLSEEEMRAQQQSIQAN